MPAVELTSFAFAAGSPDAELIVDARVLPNPADVRGLKGFTGHDAPVQHFLGSQPDVQQFVQRETERIRQSAREDSSLRVAIGCVAGRHRSVYVAEQIAASLRAEGIAAVVAHRELERESSAHRHTLYVTRWICPVCRARR